MAEAPFCVDYDIELSCYAAGSPMVSKSSPFTQTISRGTVSVFQVRSGLSRVLRSSKLLTYSDIRRYPTAHIILTVRIISLDVVTRR